MLPTITVVMPVRNEGPAMRRCLEQLVAQDYPAPLFDIIVVDGMSTDDTVAVVDACAAAFPSHAIRSIPNPHQQRASGLNCGLRAAHGALVVRLDARTVIGPTYVRLCVERLLATGAVNVGGVQVPMVDPHARFPLMQRAIGLAMSHPYGVGNAAFRTGKKSGPVDSVYLGCFRRDIFDQVGLFDDVAPIISEDAEMNQRIAATGALIYCDADIKAHYVPRDRLRDLARLYFRYGGARAGAWLKTGRLTSLRQCVAPALVLWLASGPLWALAHGARWWGAGVAIYVAATVGVSGRLAQRAGTMQLWGRLLGAFSTMHLTWGSGFLWRLLQGRRSQRPWTY